MYVGRVVIIGRSEGMPFVGYRLSSRSFSNRMALTELDSVRIVPKDAKDLSKSPYISYNCIKVIGDRAVATNGSHTEPIAEKIESGYPPRDAIALTLLAMDYERDQYKTPRIAGVIDKNGRGCLGIVQSDGINVKEFKLEDEAFFIATYEKTGFEQLHTKVKGSTAAEIAKAMYELEFENPVCAAATLWDGEFKTGVYNIM